MALSDRAAVVGRATLGAVGFCTRVPLGHRKSDWESFRKVPAAMVLVAFPIGLLAALPLLVGLPRATATFLFPAWLYLLTGITHLDGLADLGDAMAVHGTRTERQRAMGDSEVGVGALAAVVLAVLGLALAGWALVGAPWQLAVAVVVTAEVGAKTGVVAVVAVGRPTHEGLGSALSAPAGRETVAIGSLFALPLVALWAGLTGLSLAVPASAFAGALVGAGGVFLLARQYLGGVSGDVFGAANELARVLALHAGVIAWTL